MSRVSLCCRRFINNRDCCQPKEELCLHRQTDNIQTLNNTDLVWPGPALDRERKILGLTYLEICCYSGKLYEFVFAAFKSLN